MQIVIPGALPDPGTARELTPYLEKTAPALVSRMMRNHASVQALNMADIACTALESWLLQQHRFAPKNNQTFSAGLGPLWAGDTENADEPVWLAELVHVSPSRDGAGLLTARQLSITPEQSLALFEAAKGLFEAPGIELLPTSTERWRLRLPERLYPASASPALVSATRVNDWWPQDTATRPLRRLINEVQMTWHEHPVNLERQARGLAAINSLWVFGGASPGQLGSPVAPFELRDELQEPFERQDWGAWLEGLGRINTRLSTASSNPLVLLGEHRIVTLTPSRLHQRLARLFSKRSLWRHWWSPQNS